ncbi:hypothetical protein B0T26DRAFT_167024 [Lasiosphaeria miniovina]|uniref:Uncharacterized protein n=1 Tax=Lasiosphaeria miniovina TaxID=1954250 RepID=A0AA40B5X6_9PEZI|nr:uncharacterized protein B0T26DRAFT_167024 [Lasiosphaeria miniovina]KAK0728310.1 hypothetical protein B0T26DRAFT_167024 [Lasiosphaeria miniovina]
MHLSGPLLHRRCCGQECGAAFLGSARHSSMLFQHPPLIPTALESTFQPPRRLIFAP